MNENHDFICELDNDMFLLGIVIIIYNSHQGLTEILIIIIMIIEFSGSHLDILLKFKPPSVQYLS